MTIYRNYSLRNFSVKRPHKDHEEQIINIVDEYVAEHGILRPQIWTTLVRVGSEYGGVTEDKITNDTMHLLPRLTFCSKVKAMIATSDRERSIVQSVANLYSVEQYVVWCGIVSLAVKRDPLFISDMLSITRATLLKSSDESHRALTVRAWVKELTIKPALYSCGDEILPTKAIHRNLVADGYHIAESRLNNIMANHRHALERNLKNA